MTNEEWDWLNTLAKETNAKFAALADAHTRLLESEARTDESLNSLINVVERYISERHTGSSGKAE
jgi:hypothetical protein